MVLNRLNKYGPWLSNVVYHARKQGWKNESYANKTTKQLAEIVLTWNSWNHSPRASAAECLDSEARVSSEKTTQHPTCPNFQAGKIITEERERERQSIEHFQFGSWIFCFPTLPQLGLVTLTKQHRALCWSAASWGGIWLMSTPPGPSAPPCCPCNLKRPRWSAWRPKDHF